MLEGTYRQWEGLIYKALGASRSGTGPEGNLPSPLYFSPKTLSREDPPRTCTLSSRQRRFSAATIPGSRHKSENGQREERQILRLDVAPPRQPHSAFENGIFWPLLFRSAETFQEVSAPGIYVIPKKRALNLAAAQDSPQLDCVPGQYSMPQSVPADSSIMYRLRELGTEEFSVYSQHRSRAFVLSTVPHSEPSPRDSQAPLPDSMFPQLRLSSTDSSSTRGSSCSSKGGASGPPAWPLRTACATRRRYVIRPNRSSRGSFPVSKGILHSFNRRRPCCCDRMRPPAKELFLTLHWSRPRPPPESCARLGSVAQRVRPRGHAPPRRYHLVGHANLIDHAGESVQRDHHRRVSPMGVGGGPHLGH